MRNNNNIEGRLPYVCICFLTFGSFFSGVLFMRDPSEGDAKKDVARRGATWGGGERGKHREIYSVS